MSQGEHDRLVHRLSLILLKLNQGEALEPKALSQEFGVNLRTIQRDLNHRFTYLPLQRVGGRYSLEPAYLGRLTLKDVQAFAAFAGVQGLFPQLTQEFLRDVFDTRFRSGVLVRGHHYESLDGKEQMFRTVKHAVADRRTVSFCQLRNGQRKHFRSVEPHRLLNHKGVWYLAAKDGGKLKTFAFGSIDVLMLDEATFDPDPTVDAALQGDGLWIGAEPLEVTLSVSRDVAHYFKRRPVLVNQTILEERKDGTLLLSSRVGHDNEILPQVRYWVPHLQIVSPLSLRERLVIGMRQYLAAAAPDARHQPYKEAP